MPGADSASVTLRLQLAGPGGRATLTPELVASLREALRADQAARVVMIEGSSDAFCQGLELGLLAEDGALPGTDAVPTLLGAFADLLGELAATDRPVVAIVDGPALGGGVGIAAAADLVLATKRATFALPETLFGLIPGVVFPYISARIGVPRARALALSGRTLSAAEAYAWGLVDEVCEDPWGSARKLVRRLVRQDRHAQAELKRLVREHFGIPGGYMPAAREGFASLLGSAATRARLARFAAGETPWDDETEAIG